MIGNPQPEIRPIGMRRSVRPEHPHEQFSNVPTIARGDRMNYDITVPIVTTFWIRARNLDALSGCQGHHPLAERLGSLPTRREQDSSLSTPFALVTGR